MNGPLSPLKFIRIRTSSTPLEPSGAATDQADNWMRRGPYTADQQVNGIDIAARACPHRVFQNTAWKS